MAADEGGRTGFRDTGPVGAGGNPAEQKAIAGARRDGEASVGSRGFGGYALLDPLGHKLGHVERMFCNRYGEPQYVRIRTGLFGRRLALIPVMDVAADHESRELTLR